MKDVKLHLNGNNNIDDTDILNKEPSITTMVKSSPVCEPVDMQLDNNRMKQKRVGSLTQLDGHDNAVDDDEMNAQEMTSNNNEEIESFIISKLVPKGNKSAPKHSKAAQKKHLCTNGGTEI